MMRSFLFVPADSERKLQKAGDAGADALILDLEDSVAAAARPEARSLAREYLAGKDNVWVRINPMESDDAAADLEGVMPAAPAGIVLPKPRSAAAAIELDKRLSALESKHGIEPGSTRILVLCTEHPEALFTLHSYIGATERLMGLTWGAEDLSAAVGATANRDDEGNWLPTYEMARSCCRLTRWRGPVACSPLQLRKLLRSIRFSLISKTPMDCDDMHQMQGVTGFPACSRFIRRRSRRSMRHSSQQRRSCSARR